MDGFVHSYRLGLAPKKVAESYSNWATGDVHQRKVLFTGQRFFVVYWEGGEGKRLLYTSSINGELWLEPSTLLNYGTTPFAFSTAPGDGGHAGNVDFELFGNGTIYAFLEGDDTRVYNRKYTISGNLLIPSVLGSLTGLGILNGGNIVCLLNNKTRTVCLSNVASYRVTLYEGQPSNSYKNYANTPSYNATTGGAQVVKYKTSPPYDAIVVLKDGDNALHYSIVQANTLTLNHPPTAMNITLASGFSSFCACSEAQSIGDPERVHLVYIKGTGELCYRKFENDAWSSELVLASSGASYPVIACGKGGRLYVFYVKGGRIMVQKLNVNGTLLRSPERILFPKHAYRNPAYLSTNQNVQNGKICLVWTEGSAAPYEVWFAYLEDR